MVSVSSHVIVMVPIGVNMAEDDSSKRTEEAVKKPATTVPQSEMLSEEDTGLSTVVPFT